MLTTEQQEAVINRLTNLTDEIADEHVEAENVPEVLTTEPWSAERQASGGPAIQVFLDDIKLDFYVDLSVGKGYGVLEVRPLESSQPYKFAYLSKENGYRFVLGADSDDVVYDLTGPQGLQLAMRSIKEALFEAYGLTLQRIRNMGQATPMFGPPHVPLA